MKYALISEEQIKQIEDALDDARIFIRNGAALGFIRMPDLDCPDPAHNTPKHINQALTIIQSLKPQDPTVWMYETNGNHLLFSTTLPPDDAYDEGTLAPLFALEQS